MSELTLPEATAEIERLCGWLELLGGVMAMAALRGDPVPLSRHQAARVALQRKLEELR